MTKKEYILYHVAVTRIQFCSHLTHYSQSVLNLYYIINCTVQFLSTMIIEHERHDICHIV